MNLELISRNRSSIYGISMLWIMLFHSSFSFSKTWMLPLLIAKNMGNCGVDIFLFVSGISLYFSLSKQNCSLKDFYVHRIKRIVFPTLVTSMLWFGFLAPNPAPDISAFLLDVTGISLFIYGKRTIWFVTTIMICYVVYPLLYSVNKKTDNSLGALVIIVLMCIILNIILRSYVPMFWKNSEILFRRIPIFVIGSFCGKYVYEKRSLPFSVNQCATISIIIVVIYILTRPYWIRMIPERYVYIIVSISCTVLFSIIGNVSVINHIAAWFAPITFEVYLCHEKWISIITRLFPTIGSVGINLASFVLCIATARLMVFLENGVYNKLAFRNKPELFMTSGSCP